MFEALERTMVQSECMKAQMDKAVEKTLQAWRRPGTAKQGDVDTAIEEIRTQIDTLTKKVAELERTLADKK